MSSRSKKYRLIHVKFRERVIEFEMDKNLQRWEGNSKMWKKFLKSVKSKFKLKSRFSIYDPNDDMFVDDMDDLCGCYIGYEDDYSFILSLHVKADKEPEWNKKKNTKTNGSKAKTQNKVAVSSLITQEIDELSAQNSNDFLENMSELRLKPLEAVKAELGVSRRQSRRLSIDFGLFNNPIANDRCELNTVWLDFGAKRIRHCDQLNRLISGLKYYSNLDFKNDIDKDEFNNFFDDTYTNMLEDYMHVLAMHSEDLEEIMSISLQYTKCDIRLCPHTKRHFLARNDEDPWINFYIQLYDSLHFWLFHMFDTGLRSLKHDLKMDKYQRRKEERDHSALFCYDAQFNKVVTILRQKQENTKFLNCKRYTIDKYDLNLSLNCDSNIIKDKDSERLTFKDSLMFHLQKTVKQRQILQKFNAFINREAYDSDAIIQDITQYSHSGNIWQIISKNQECLQQMREYIRNTKIRDIVSFSIGLVFYYWPYYKQCRDATVESNGYTSAELYVEMKHATFKQEILSYMPSISIWEYNNLIVLKAKQYQQLRITKEIGIKFNPHLHFDVFSTALTRENIIALVIYTDFTQVTRTFAATFRQCRMNESLQSIKLRNQCFWWLSKTLRETVQYFGLNGSPSGEYIKGPFYTSVRDRVCVIPEFNIRLSAPVSTSKQMQVVSRFMSDDKGMLVQLNNNGENESARYLRSFYIGWISKYKEETETLFIGGDWQIRIETIKLISTKQNFSKYFDALFLFDCMCNGFDIEDNTSEIKPVSFLPLKASTSAAAHGTTPKPKNAHHRKRPNSAHKKPAINSAKTPKAKSIFKAQKSQTKIFNVYPSQKPSKNTKKTKKRRHSSTNIPSMASNSMRQRRHSSAVIPSIYEIQKFETENEPKNNNNIFKFDFKNNNKSEKSVTEVKSGEMKEKALSQNHKVIKLLIDNKLGTQIIPRSAMPQYIIHSFNTFCKDKKVVTLNLFYLHKNFAQFIDLIMHPIEVDRHKTMNTAWMPNPYSVKNTLTERFFTLFDSVHKLVIYSTKYDGFPSYSFSLMSLLSSVDFNNSSLKEIVIKATHAQKKRSWLYEMFESSPLYLVRSMLKESRCKIQLTEHKNSMGNMEDWLVIDRV